MTYTGRPGLSHIKSLLGGVRSQLAAGLDAEWEPRRITVTFSNGRKQVIRYRQQGDSYIFTSYVARPAAVKKIQLKSLARRILERNRATEVVTFGLGRNGRVEAWINHRAGSLQPGELKFYLAVLAREADRFEYLLTGKDVN